MSHSQVTWAATSKSSINTPISGQPCALSLPASLLDEAKTFVGTDGFRSVTEVVVAGTRMLVSWLWLKRAIKKAMQARGLTRHRRHDQAAHKPSQGRGSM